MRIRFGGPLYYNLIIRSPQNSIGNYFIKALIVIQNSGGLSDAKRVWGYVPL